MNKNMNKKYLGNALLLLTGMIWGSGFAGQRLGMETEIGPIAFNAARMLLAGIFISLVVAVMAVIERSRQAAGKRAVSPRERAAERQQTGKDKSKYTILGGLCCGAVLAAAATFQQVGIVYTTAGKAGFITAMYILIVPVISFLFLKKKYTWIVWLAVVIGVVGMYFLSVREGLSFGKGDLLMLVCAVFFSLHILCCDYFVQRGHAVRISAIQFFTCSLISGILAQIFEHPTWEQTASAILPILYLGIVSGGIGYTLQIVAQQYTEPTIASLLMSTESVFAVISGALILHERMNSRETLGCLLIFAAIILAQAPIGGKRKQES